MKKLIIIPTRFEKNNEILNDLAFFFNDEYELRIVNNYNEFDLLIDKCAGVIMPGGADINPKYYYEEITYTKNINDELDLNDKRILEACEKRNIPYMGICRGMQLLCVILGGSLYQDMEKQNIIHTLDEFENHDVKRLVSFRLSKLLPEEFTVNSIHHQCVKDIPLNFVPLFSCGNVIESIISYNKPIFGVQWHPEKLRDDVSLTIFNYFKDLINERNC